jgi:hypothetical protein
MGFMSDQTIEALRGHPIVTGFHDEPTGSIQYVVADPPAGDDVEADQDDEAGEGDGEGALAPGEPLSEPRFIVPGLMLATSMPLQMAIGTSLVAVSAFGAATAGPG